MNILMNVVTHMRVVYEVMVGHRDDVMSIRQINTTLKVKIAYSDCIELLVGALMRARSKYLEALVVIKNKLCVLKPLGRSKLRGSFGAYASGTGLVALPPLFRCHV